MDQTPFDIVTTAFELIITVLVLSTASTLMFLGSRMMQSYQKEIDVSNMMTEYSTYSKYDDTTLSGSDVVEAIHLYADDVFPIKVGSSTFQDANYSLDNLVGSPASVIHLDKDYKAELRVGTNGNISGIVFSEVP